jgi:SAM-dependent methyltransferase
MSLDAGEVSLGTGSGFDSSWERIYSGSQHLSVWPWSDVVSFVNRYVPSAGGGRKVCELGCGAGANIPLFERRGDDYHGVEGSETMVNELKKKFHAYADKIVCGDFTSSIPFEGEFDLILDRASLTHNDTESIERCLKVCCSKLTKDGVFLGIDWFSARHSDAICGRVVDEYTRTELGSRQFLNVGNVHFSDRKHLVEIFARAGFEITVLVHKESEILIGDAENMHRICAFNFVAVKLG